MVAKQPNGLVVNRLFSSAVNCRSITQNGHNGNMLEDATANADNVELNDIQDTDVATALHNKNLEKILQRLN